MVDTFSQISAQGQQTHYWPVRARPLSPTPFWYHPQPLRCVKGRRVCHEALLDARRILRIQGSRRNDANHQALLDPESFKKCCTYAGEHMGARKEHEEKEKGL